MDELNALRAACAGCTGCGLAATRHSVVFGVGPCPSPVVFIGEGPGQQEDLRGEPFVGPAGQLLDGMLSIIDLGRHNCYICNIVKCRPLADINEKGLSDVIGKTRGLAPALKATIDYMARTVERPEEQIMLLSHSDRPERAEELRALVEERFHPKELHVVPVCQSCGASIGPGLYAIFYFGRPISSGLTEERSLIAELTGKTK